MKIGELATAAGCSVETVRYYEKEGLLEPPGRTEGNYRDYAAAQVERLRFIRNCRALDMTQQEIRGLLELMGQPNSDCGAVNRLVDEHIAHVDGRILELTRLKRQLKKIRHACAQRQSIGDCGILQGLVDMAPVARPEKHTHLG